MAAALPCKVPVSSRVATAYQAPATTMLRSPVTKPLPPSLCPLDPKHLVWLLTALSSSRLPLSKAELSLRATVGYLAPLVAVGVEEAPSDMPPGWSHRGPQLRLGSWGLEASCLGAPAAWAQEEEVVLIPSFPPSLCRHRHHAPPPDAPPPVAPGRLAPRAAARRRHRRLPPRRRRHRRRSPSPSHRHCRAAPSPSSPRAARPPPRAQRPVPVAPSPPPLSLSPSPSRPASRRACVPSPPCAARHHCRAVAVPSPRARSIAASRPVPPRRRRVTRPSLPSSPYSPLSPIKAPPFSPLLTPSPPPLPLHLLHAPPSSCRRVAAFEPPRRRPRAVVPPHSCRRAAAVV
ncbi:hypothetical protein DAI22_08g200050 [Oryza sativa Japonica Group]|nr:hypothetical protein DAI22_08g200050 [Oryza sativa Japonica Group]